MHAAIPNSCMTFGSSLGGVFSNNANDFESLVRNIW
jgi:hypothetical protein